MNSLDSININKFRLSGHETFTCRYTWLPKILNFLINTPEDYLDADKGMIALGVGKNMYASMRFWAESADLIRKDTYKTNSYLVDETAKSIFIKSSHSNPFDPFLENIYTAWILHWMISTSNDAPLFFWQFILNNWHRHDFSEVELVNAMKGYYDRKGKEISRSTLESTFRVFVNSYCPNNSNDVDDISDCPFIELGLLRKTGNRRNISTNKLENLYSFNISLKQSISDELFLYILNDFWERYFPNEKTLPLKEISSGFNSPGQILKIPEQNIVERLTEITKISNGALKFDESLSMRQVIKDKSLDSAKLLKDIYK